MENRPGFLAFRAAGPGARGAFQNEGGGHRWQRIPPTEKRGRVQTSTVTVAVLDEPTDAEFRINPADLQVTFTRGSGPGGQNRNKVETVVVIVHGPTGLSVRCQTERSQHQNRELAMGLLRARLAERKRLGDAAAQNASRKAQVGAGCRGDKIMTVRMQDGIVTDHRTGRKMRASDYLKGIMPGESGQ